MIVHDCKVHFEHIGDRDKTTIMIILQFVPRFNSIPYNIIKEGANVYVIPR